jgi:hypothetical protein
MNINVELWNSLSDTLSAKVMWPEVIVQWDVGVDDQVAFSTKKIHLY